MFEFQLLNYLVFFQTFGATCQWNSGTAMLNAGHITQGLFVNLLCLEGFLGGHSILQAISRLCSRCQLFATFRRFKRQICIQIGLLILINDGNVSLVKIEKRHIMVKFYRAFLQIPCRARFCDHWPHPYILGFNLKASFHLRKVSVFNTNYLFAF